MTVINGPQANASPPLRNPDTKLFSITEVLPELLVCGAAAITEDALRDGKVDCVVSAAAELPPLPLAPSLATVLRIPVLDNLNENLSDHLHLVADTIDTVRSKGGKTLVHCVAGVSRSAALCLAYLVKYGGMTLRRAFAHLRDRRPCVRPNANFFTQLIKFEEQTRGSTTVTMVYNSAAKAIIPDVYEEDYEKTLIYMNRNCGRN